MLAHNVNQQLDLFSPNRWPKKPYCSDDKTARHIRCLSSALKRPYIQANPPHLRVWSIYDIDREGAAYAWEDANLPPPSWTAINQENGHAHIVYGMSAPVLVDSPDMRQAPLRYLCAVEAAFRTKLDADQDYAGLLTKNPAHPLWRTLRGPRLDYDLGELAEYVDLPKHIPKRGKKPEEIGLGRNVTVFEDLRQWAYRNIRGYKAEGFKGWNPWMADCNEWALQRNGDLPNPMDSREVWHIAKSVAKWTWRRLDIAASDARFSQLQAHRGKKGGIASGVTRLEASEDKRVSARLMAGKGIKTGRIAQELNVDRKTIQRWLLAERKGSAEA